jgi:hypothetical protein
MKIYQSEFGDGVKPATRKFDLLRILPAWLAEKYLRFLLWRAWRKSIV